MPEKNLPDPTRDPTTRALETFIEASVEQLLDRQDSPNAHGLLFLSAWHEAMPALVHLDPILDPVDSRVFAVLWLWARQQGRGSTAFPSYEYFLQRCNIHSRSTLARSLTILRITRWITLCRRVRDAHGRYRGNIYALHEEPLALASTLYLDPSYMEFLHAATRHGHAQVRKIAQVMLESLQTRIDAGEDVLTASPLTQTSQRIEALDTVAGQGSGNFFSFHHLSLATLQSVRQNLNTKRAEPSNLKQSLDTEQRQTPVQNLDLDTVRKSNSPPVQKSNSALCSSRYLNKKTTTTSAAEEDQKAPDPSSTLALVFPEALSANERQLAPMYLKGLGTELQQALLDELGAKLRQQAKTAHPVRNPIGLLAWMCQAARAGQPPLTSAHLQYRAIRERARRVAEHDEAEQRRLTELAVGKNGSSNQRHGPLGSKTEVSP